MFFIYYRHQLYFIKRTLRLHNSVKYEGKTKKKLLSEKSTP